MTIRNPAVKVGQGFALLSDLHLGSAHADEGLIREELEEARLNRDRVLINGDVFDLILPTDSKRFQPHVVHPRFQGAPDLINKVLDFATDFLEPYADRIDMIGSGNHECHSHDTEVLTERGWKLFRNLDAGDLLATVTPNLSLQYQKPSRVTCDWYEGTMYHFKGVAIDALVTPNHRMLVRKSVGRYEFVTAEELYSADWSSRRIPLTAYSNNPEYAVDDDYLRLLGWIITDGCVSGPPNKRVVTIYQRESKHHLITDLLTRMGVPFSLRKRTRNITHICGRKLLAPPEPECSIRLLASAQAAEVKELFADGKHVPAWVGRLSRRQFRVFLSAVVDGDGSRHRGSNTSWMVYGKRHVIDPLHHYAVANGWRASVYTYRGEQLRLNLSDTLDDRSIQKKQIVPVSYTGFVYCATVPNGTLITRRNGRTLISGNSAVEKHHSFDPVLQLVDNLNARLKCRKNPHRVKHGGYCGFAVYPVAGAAGEAFRLFYHHGFGGGSTLSGAAGDFNRLLAQVEGVDLVWLGHKHQKLAGHAVRIAPAAEGDHPLTQAVRYVRTGAYLDATKGQSQESLRQRGRQSIYSVDKGYPFAGLGGARVVLKSANPVKVRVTQ